MQIIIGDRGELFNMVSGRQTGLPARRRRSVLGIVADLCVAGYLVTAAVGFFVALGALVAGYLP